MNAAPPPPDGTMRTVWRTIWTSRLVVLFCGMAGVIQIGVAGGAWNSYDRLRLTAPFGYLANALVAPLARWDSVWYLRIAEHGYAGVRERMAFFPLYPLVMHVVAYATRSELVAGALVSLVAMAVALGVLHRLVRLDFGEEIAGVTVMLIAFCPMSFFLSAVYTESLFLALSIGSIYLARRERWFAAGLLGGLAALSRNGGVLLILPTLIIYLYGPRAATSAATTRWGRRPLVGVRRLLPRFRLRPDVLWLLLIPAGLGAYLAYLGSRYGDALAPFRVEKVWYRHSTVPYTTVWHGAQQAWDGLRQLLHGPGSPNYVPAYAQSVISAALQDVYLFLFLILGVVGLVGVARRLPVAYSLYSFAMLLVALADPVSLQPLASLPRYELVIFPLFIWGARLVVRHRLTVPAVATLAVLLGFFTVEFATWRWVA